MGKAVEAVALAAEPLPVEVLGSSPRMTGHSDLPPDQRRRLACLALAVEMQRTGDGADAVIARAKAFNDWVYGNPYTSSGDD